MSNINWLENTTTVTRPTSVVRVHGYGTGVVCTELVGMSAGSVKRHAINAFQAATAPGSGQPWSPPIT